MIFVVRRMNLPYAGCFTSRSTETVTLFCILLLTTRPTVLRVVLPVLVSLVSALIRSRPLSAVGPAYFFAFKRSVCSVFSRAIDLRTLPCWSGFAP